MCVSQAACPMPGPVPTTPWVLTEPIANWTQAREGRWEWPSNKKTQAHEFFFRGKSKLRKKKKTAEPERLANFFFFFVQAFFFSNEILYVECVNFFFSRSLHHSYSSITPPVSKCVCVRCVCVHLCVCASMQLCIPLLILCIIIK
jgi:hypothetical protein